MNIAIFSPHEDKDSYSNRNLIYSIWAKKNKINTTLYVSSFNYKTHKQKKLKNFFFETEDYKGIKIYRVYSCSFKKSYILRMISYVIFSILSLFIFFLIDKKKYNFVIGESVPPLCSYFAYLCSLKNNSKFIYQIRDPWPLSIFYSGLIKKKSLVFIFLEAINKFLIKKSKFIISVLPYLESHYKKYYNYKKKIYYLRNPSDTSSFLPSAYPKVKKKIKIIYAGGFIASIKILNYFKAIHSIQKRKIFNFSYYFLGEGVDLEKCKNFSKIKDLKNIFFLKSIPKKKVLNFISKFHLCIAVVSKNRNNKFGYNLNKIVDYATSARPIIFTNNLKKNCFVDKNKMGFNSAATPNDIVKKIINFKNLSYKSKVSMARNARKFAINELDIKRLYKVYSNIFYQNLNV
jgi:hypothetical protein